MFELYVFNFVINCQTVKKKKNPRFTFPPAGYEVLLHILTHTGYHQSYSNVGYSDACLMLSLGFNLYFPDQYVGHVLLSHSCVFFGKVIFKSLCHWSELYGLFLYFRYKSFVRFTYMFCEYFVPVYNLPFLFPQQCLSKGWFLFLAS